MMARSTQQVRLPMLEEDDRPNLSLLQPRTTDRDFNDVPTDEQRAREQWGRWHGYQDVYSKQKTIDRYTLAHMPDRFYAAGYRQGAREARKFYREAHGIRSGAWHQSSFNPTANLGNFARPAFG